MSSFASDILFDLLDLLIVFPVAQLFNGNSSSSTSEKLTGFTAHAQSFSKRRNRYQFATMLSFEMKLERTKLIFTFRQFVGFLKEGPRANASNAFLLNTALLQFSSYFLPLNNLS